MYQLSATKAPQINRERFDESEENEPKEIVVETVG